MDVAPVSTSLFELLATDGGGRAGVIHTPHGDLQTPLFAPVGEQDGRVRRRCPKKRLRNPDASFPFRIGKIQHGIRPLLFAQKVRVDDQDAGASRKSVPLAIR